MSDWTGRPDATPGALTPNAFMNAQGIPYEMLGLFRMEQSVDSGEGKILLNENFKQIAETLRTLAPSQYEIELKSKSADYTTVSDDFGGYLRFTAEATLTVHSPVVADVGKSFLVANSSTTDTVTVATAATFNIDNISVLAPGSRAVFIVSADGQYDVFGT